MKTTPPIPTILVGCTGFAIGRLKAMLDCEGLTPVACVDIQLGAARKEVEQVPGAMEIGLSNRIYSSIAEARENHSARACLIYSTTHAHADLVVESLDLGLHTLCVKPIACSEAEFVRIMEAYRRNPDSLLVQGQNMRWNPASLKMQEWMNSSNGIGQFVGGECRFWIRQPWRMKSPTETLPGSFFHIVCCHQLDQLVLTQGLPAFVTARNFNHIERDLAEVASEGAGGGCALFEFPNGSVVSYTGTRAGHSDGVLYDWSGHWTLHGTEGDIVREVGHLRLFRRGECIEELWLDDYDSNRIIKDDGIQFEAFARAIRSGEKRTFLQYTSWMNWVVMEACNKSAATGERIDVQQYYERLVGVAAPDIEEIV